LILIFRFFLKDRIWKRIWWWTWFLLASHCIDPFTQKASSHVQSLKCYS